MKKETAAIVLAAGRGTRMKSKVAKQFIELKGKPLVYYSLKAFEEADIQHIVLVTSKENIDYCKKEIVEKYDLKNVDAVVEGGRERYHSVMKGLEVLQQYSPEVVMIHDGARPFVTSDIIDQALKCVSETGACIAGVPVKDTIKVVNSDLEAIDTPERSTLWQIQTPQTFSYNSIYSAYKNMMQEEDNTITDDAMVMELYGKNKIKVFMGDYKNIKITTPEDLIIAEKYLSI